MTGNRPAFDMRIDLKTVIQVLALAGALIAGYVKFEGRVEAVVVDVGSIRKQTTRIEHYLSASDSAYWKKTHENGDSQ
jgi:hypothetical protein